ncbi:MAG: class I SAM-dependent methyltransferase [Bacillota bacterium]
MDTIYTDGTYLRNNPAWHQDDSPWKARQIAKLLERNGVSPRSIAEVGCGAGEILRELSREYPQARCVGYEISPEAYEICRRKGSGTVSYKLGDIAEDSTTYDVAMAIDVFEHVEDYFAFLRRIRPCATHKVFHIPLELSVRNVIAGKPLLDARRSVGHIHHFSRETALAALHDTGYAILDEFYTSGRTELPNLSWRSKLLKWPRKAAYLVSADMAVRVLGGYSLMVLAK